MGNWAKLITKASDLGHTHVSFNLRYYIDKTKAPKNAKARSL